MRLPDLAVVGVFAAFLAAPIGSLAVMGPDPASEKRVTWSELSAEGLFSRRDTYRNDIARRLVSNSPVGMDAIRAKSELDWEVFGYVNTPQVVSGADDWLFYKPGFLGGKCLSDRDIEAALGRIAAMREVAKAVDIDYRVSVSPDKEVVYPEKLGAASVLASCKIALASRWRQKAEESGAIIIDHLKAFDRTNADDLLYFKTDTHWNDLGKAKALQQLAEAYLGRNIPGPKGPTSEKAKNTDIVRNMLRLENMEAYQSYDAFWKTDFPSAVGPGIADAVIVHDSFYASAQQGLNELFKEPVFIDYTSSAFDGDINAAVEKRPKHILANTVERFLFPRLLVNELSWKRGMGAALLDANKRAAMKCQVADVVESELVPTRAVVNGSRSYKTGKDPQFRVVLPHGGRPCLHFSFETTGTSASEVYLPAIDQKTGKDRYVRGFGIDFQDTSPKRDFWLLLTEDYAGRTIRLDPINEVGQISNFRVQVGSL